MNAKQQVGVLMLVAALVAGVWSYNRYSGLVGQMHGWTMPLSKYEVFTLVGALVATLLLMWGLRMVFPKKDGKPAQQEPTPR